MILREITRNSHVLDLSKKVGAKANYRQQIATLSDLHWDNPKCDRDLLKKHLDLCLKNDYRIHLNGDTFCLMQGKYDPRKSKSSIRPEHNVNNYLDAVVEDAANWFKPYAHLIDVVGYGNHETNIIKRMETDPLQRFVDALNGVSETDHKVFTGGYGGWYILSFGRASYKIKYFHGSGGGGVVTRGEINLTRALSYFHGCDCFMMGHVHENKESNVIVETLDAHNKQIDKEILLMITGTYKEEYDGGFMGFHVERGAPPKPVGGRLLTLDYNRKKTGRITIKAKSEKL